MIRISYAQVSVPQAVGPEATNVELSRGPLADSDLGLLVQFFTLLAEWDARNGKEQDSAPTHVRRAVEKGENLK